MPCSEFDYVQPWKPPNCCIGFTSGTKRCPRFWTAYSFCPGEPFEFLTYGLPGTLGIYSDSSSDQFGTTFWHYRATINDPLPRPNHWILEKERDNDAPNWKLRCVSAAFSALDFAIPVVENADIGPLYFPPPGVPVFGPEDPNQLSDGVHLTPYWKVCQAVMNEPNGINPLMVTHPVPFGDPP